MQSKTEKRKKVLEKLEKEYDELPERDKHGRFITTRAMYLESQIRNLNRKLFG